MTTDATTTVQGGTDEGGMKTMAIGSLIYSVLVEEGDGVGIEGGFEEEEISSTQRMA